MSAERWQITVRWTDADGIPRELAAGHENGQARAERTARAYVHTMEKTGATDAAWEITTDADLQTQTATATDTTEVQTMKAELVTISSVQQTPREQAEETLWQTQATAEDLERTIADLNAGHCDHGATCEGTAHGVDCTSCYQFTYNGLTRGVSDEPPEPFTCDAGELLAALKRVKLAVSRKSSLPVLSGVRIESGELTTTDMDVTVVTRVQGSGAVSIVAPVALLEKCIAKLSGIVTLEADGLDLHVSAGSRAYTVQGFAPEDFPQTVSIASQAMPLAAAPSWREAWEKVRRAVSTDDTRPILATVFVNGREVVTTDSYRLARYILPDDTADMPQSLVLRRACEVVAKLKGDVSYGARPQDPTHCGVCKGSGKGTGDLHTVDDPSGPGRTMQTNVVDCYACKGSGNATGPDFNVSSPAFGIVDKSGAETRVYARPVEGQFPNVKQLIPDPSSLMSATIDKSAIIGALDAVSVMAQKNAPVRLSFNGSLTLATTTQDVGAASESIDYAGDIGKSTFVEGSSDEPDAYPEGFIIGLNPEFLADGLACIESAEVTLDVSNPLRPVLLHAPQTDVESGFLYLLMPVRIAENREREDRERDAKNAEYSAKRCAEANARAAVAAASQDPAERERDYAFAS